MDTRPTAQNRPTPAAPPHPDGAAAVDRRALSLRTRLILVTALTSIVVVAGITLLEDRVAERALRDELRDLTASTASSLADELGSRDGLPAAGEVEARLHRMLATLAALDEIDVFARGPGGGLIRFASTFPAGGRRPSIEDTRVAEGQDMPAQALVREGQSMWRVIQPIRRGDRIVGVVDVLATLSEVSLLRAEARNVGLIFAPIVVALLIVSVEWMVRRYVHRPLGDVSDTMTRAEQGDLDARVAPQRTDEIGAIAEGLNSMLDQIRAAAEERASFLERLSGFNAELQRRVEAATEALRERNEELVDLNRRLFDAQRALGRAERLAAAGEVASSFAHQIGTPLNLISGYVQVLRETAPADGDLHRKLTIVSEQIERLTETVRGALEDVRKPSVATRRIDLAALLERLSEVSRPTLAVRGIQLESAVAPALPPLEADPQQLEHAFLTLLTNAIDAMPAGGNLRLSTTVVDGSVQIQVADTGEGIAPDLLPKIFRPYFTTKEIGRGTGLGLSIAKEIIVAHGGTIDVESEPGKGTTFTIRLPA